MTQDIKSELSGLWGEVVGLYHGDEQSAAQFLLQPNSFLRSKRPLDVALQSGYGQLKVSRYVKQAAAGVYI